MTIKTAACAMAVTLLAGTATFIVSAAAQRSPTPSSHAKLTSSHSKRLFLSTVAVYDAGLRRGTANSSRNAYLRGFLDGTSSEAYSSRYLVGLHPGYPVTSAPTPAYSNFGRDAVYVLGSDSYSTYDSYKGRSISYGNGYGNGYGDSSYNAGYAPRGLMDVAVAPVVTTPSLEAQAARLSYCVARYQSFDTASGTFLASDGYRYYCR
jgi:hypothetical protein